MFRIAYKQLICDWKTVLAIFVILFASALILTALLFLASTAIHHAILGAKSPLDDPKVPSIVFNTMGAISIFVAVVITSMIVNQSIKRRKQWFVRLRIIGATHRQMMNLVFIENSIMLFFAFLLGAPISIPFADFIRDYLVDHHVLESAFKVEKHWFYAFASLGICLASIAIVSLISLGSLKNITISVKKPKKIFFIFKMISGAAFFVAAVVLLSIKELLHGNNGTTVATAVAFCFVIAFVIFGPYLLMFFLSFVVRLTRKFANFNITLKSMIHSMRILIVPMTMIVVGVLAIVSTSELNGIITHAKIKNSASIFSGIKSGLAFKKPAKELTDDLSMYENPETTVITDAQRIKAHLSNNKIQNITIRGLGNKSQKFVYNMPNVVGNLDKLYDTNQNNIVVDRRFVSARLNDKIDLDIAGQNIPFNVVGSYFSPDSFDSDDYDPNRTAVMNAYISLDTIQTISVNNSFKIMFIVASDESLMPFYQFDNPYDPYQALLFGSELSHHISILFSIIISIYISIAGINATGIYVSDKKKEFQLFRILSSTIKDVWKRLMYECFMFLGIVSFVALVFVVAICGSFSLANGVHFTISEDPIRLISMLLVFAFFVVVAYFVPMLYMHKSIYYINRSSR